jgi:glycosyltransferase involved in cell wall biosynthesis
MAAPALLAASLGRAVLGPDVAALRDLVQPGRSGVLYDRADPQGLEDSLRTALREGRSVWRDRGERALAHALVRDWAIAGRQWRDLFGGLAAAPIRGQSAARIVPA